MQRGPTSNARRLGIGVGLREDDVLDASRIDSAALDHRLDNPRSEILGAQRTQTAAERADGSAKRADYRGSLQASPRQRPADGSISAVKRSSGSQMIVSSSSASR